MTHLTNWALALCMVGLIATAQALDGPDDITAAQDVAADVQDAQAAAQVAAASTHTATRTTELQP